MSQVIRTGTGTTQSDIAITRVSNPTYASIPSKNDTGRPIQIYLDRQAVIPTVTMWPIPNDASYTFNKCWPVNVAPIDLDWGTNDTIEEFTVEWAYDWWSNVKSAST